MHDEDSQRPFSGGYSLGGKILAGFLLQFYLEKNGLLGVLFFNKNPFNLMFICSI